MTQTITANDRRPMISYLSLTVATALSVFVMKILTTYIFQDQSRFNHFQQSESHADQKGGFDFRHGVSYCCCI